MVNEWLSRGAVSCRIAEYLRMPAAYGSRERIPLLRSEDAIPAWLDSGFLHGWILGSCMAGFRIPAAWLDSEFSQSVEDLSLSAWSRSTRQIQ